MNPFEAQIQGCRDQKIDLTKAIFFYVLEDNYRVQKIYGISALEEFLKEGLSRMTFNEASPFYQQLMTIGPNVPIFKRGVKA